MNYRNKMQIYRTIAAMLALVLALAVAPAGAAGHDLQPPSGAVEIYQAEVVDVKDGDTFDAIIKSDLVGQVIRSLRLTDGADCPEIAQPFGRAATDRTAHLVAQGVLVEMTGRKSYNRHLVRIWLPDGRSLAAVLVAEGLAMIDPRYATGDWGAYLLDLQNTAKKLHWGQWSQPAPTPPWDYRKHRRGH